jgi:AraC family transcriptional regulator, ethanolamine operon transcriptional activator
MNFDHSHKRARNADEQAACVKHWDQRYEQLTAGRFEGEVEELCVGPVQVFFERSNQTVMQAGCMDSNRASVALVCAAQTPGWYCGHRLHAEHLIGISANGEFDMVAGADMQILALSVETRALRELVAKLDGPDIEAPTARMVLSPSRATLDAYKCLINTALQLGKDPGGACSREAARSMLALSLTSALLDCMRSGPTSGTFALPTTAASRRRIVARARQYMQAHAHEVIAVPDLCQAIGTSRRALQYAFEEVMQISPVTYLRAMRLNRVRSELRRNPEASVGDVASHWGFWHLSRFAAEYYTLFGELPSTTRAVAAAATS